MNKLSREHWLLIAGLLAGLATQVAGLETWGEAVRPSFVAGACLMVAAAIRAIYTERPK